MTDVFDHVATYSAEVEEVLVREGLERLSEDPHSYDDEIILTEAGSAEEAVRICARHGAQVITLQAYYLDMSPVEYLNWRRQEGGR